MSIESVKTRLKAATKEIEQEAKDRTHKETWYYTTARADLEIHAFTDLTLALDVIETAYQLVGRWHDDGECEVPGCRRCRLVNALDAFEASE